MKILLAAAAATIALATPALAQTSTTTTTTQTTTTEVPTTVRTYITEQSSPSIVYDGELVLGEALPDTVEIIEIPDQPDYGYAIVNDRQVVINPSTRSVIEVYD